MKRNIQVEHWLTDDEQIGALLIYGDPVNVVSECARLRKHLSNKYNYLDRHDMLTERWLDVLRKIYRLVFSVERNARRQLGDESKIFIAEWAIE